MDVAGRCITAPADSADEVTGFDTSTDDRCRLDRLQVSGVVPDTIVAGDADVQATSRRWIVHFLGPAVREVDLVDRSVDDRHHCGPASGEDISCRIVVMCPAVRR